MLRFFVVHKIRMRYLPICTHVMRRGGLNTEGLRANVQINRQDLRALKTHGIWSCHVSHSSISSISQRSGAVFYANSPLAIRAAHRSGAKVVMTLHNYRDKGNRPGGLTQRYDIMSALCRILRNI